MKRSEQLLKQVFGEVFKKGKLGPKYYENKIKNIWLEAMGPSINGYTTSLYLSGSVLKISISSSPLKQELNMGKAKILSLLNEKLGEQYLTKIEIN